MALEGIRVLDFSRFAAGPYCTMLLAKMGAEVIRIERPEGGDDRTMAFLAPDGESLVYKNLAVNKKGITLDMLSEEGKEIIKKLVKKSDIVVYNFTPGSPELSVVDYTIIKEVNPGIIVAAISGFGQNGPYAERPAFDPTIAAMSGLMWLIGFPGNPPLKDVITYLDFGTGTLTALGIMLALYHRQRTGIGQMVDASLLDTALSYIQSMGMVAAYVLLDELRCQVGNLSYSIYMNCYQAKDGWVMIAPVSDRLWRRLVKVIGRDDLLDDPRLRHDTDRWTNHQFIDSFIGPWVAERTAEEVVNVLQGARVVAEKVGTIADVVEHPQVKARQMIIDVDYPGVGKFPIAGAPLKFSETPAGIRTLSPGLGEHNEEVYRGLLGVTPEQLAQLKEKRVI